MHVCKPSSCANSLRDALLHSHYQVNSRSYRRWRTTRGSKNWAQLLWRSLSTTSKGCIMSLSFKWWSRRGSLCFVKAVLGAGTVALGHTSILICARCSSKSFKALKRFLSSVLYGNIPRWVRAQDWWKRCQRCHLVSWPCSWHSGIGCLLCSWIPLSAVFW